MNAGVTHRAPWRPASFASASPASSLWQSGLVALMQAVINSLSPTLSLQGPETPHLPATLVTSTATPCVAWGHRCMHVCWRRRLRKCETGWGWWSAGPSLMITVCSAHLYSKPFGSRHPTKRQTYLVPLSSITTLPESEREHTHKDSYFSIVVPEESSRGSELIVRGDTEDEIGADTASVMVSGRYPWL